MNIIIIEDEPLAAKALQRNLEKLPEQIDVVAILDTVEDSIAFFKSSPDIDLAFFDIQLADGLSFEILQEVPTPCPIVFTTAYDAYALQAFSVHSIDYLLKPVALEDLQRAITKWKSLTQQQTNTPVIDTQVLQLLLQGNRKEYKERFLIKIGDKLISISLKDVVFFQGENKIVWLHHRNGRKYPIDYTLEQLELLLDPIQFFRLNRSYITHRRGIHEIIQYSNSRLKINLVGIDKEVDVLVSRIKAEPFRHWLGK